MAKKQRKSPRAQAPTPQQAARRRRKFLDELAETGNVTHSCRVAAIPYNTAYKWRREIQEFAEAWDDALEMAADKLEKEAMRRAYEGVDKPVFQNGRQVGVIRQYSDTLLIFLLKGCRPEKYRELHHVKHSGSIDGKLSITDAIALMQEKRPSGAGMPKGGPKSKKGGG